MVKYIRTGTKFSNVIRGPVWGSDTNHGSGEIHCVGEYELLFGKKEPRDESKTRLMHSKTV